MCVCRGGGGVWGDADGILVADYLHKGQTINETFYGSLPRQLRESFKVKRHRKLSKDVLFHQDNAPAHSSVITMLHSMIVALNWFNNHLTHLTRSIRLQFIPKVEKGHFWYPCLVRWWRYTCSAGLSGHQEENFLALRPCHIAGKMYIHWGGLCWKIIQYISKKSNL